MAILEINSGIDCYMDLTVSTGDISQIGDKVQVNNYGDDCELILADLHSRLKLGITSDMAVVLLHELAEKLGYEVIPHE